MKNVYLLIFLLLQLNTQAGAGINNKIEKMAKLYLGSKYTWGGNKPSTGMDCSGYVQYIYHKIGINLPRTALMQSKGGKSIALSELKKGDLLFFLTDKSRHIPITHVGIYLDNNKFIHAASTKKGIIISSIYGRYKKKFIIAKRYIKGKSTFLKPLYITLDKEAAQSSMKPKITAFGGINETF